jgi:hypothetical protein
MESSQRNEMLKLYESLLDATKTQIKKFKVENAASDLIIEILAVTQNNRSKLFSTSGTWVDTKSVDSLQEQGFIQKVISEEREKYALTFRGIAECIKMKHNLGLQEQYVEFLEQADQRYNGTEKSGLAWKEKLASLSLILVGSTAISSEVRLDDEANLAVLKEVFEKTLAHLKKFGIIGRKEELKIPSGGENPVSLIMRGRINDLTRKTNLYYTNDRNARGYYFDIEKDGVLNENRLSFLLRRIFEHYDSSCNYKEMYTELARISQTYTPRFRARIVNPNVSFGILKKLKDFMENEVLTLPPISSKKEKSQKGPANLQ